MRARINLYRFPGCVLTNIKKPTLLKNSTTTCHTEIAMMIPSFLKCEKVFIDFFDSRDSHYPKENLQKLGCY